MHRFVGIVPLLLATGVFAQPADQRHDGMVVLFGTYHAHSRLSDDTPKFPENRNVDHSPLALFTYARDHGLDFLGISDHQKATDTNNRLFMTQDEYKTQLFDVAMQFNADHPGFIAIPGIEWGNTKTGNHMNVFGADALPPDSILDEEYDDLLTWARSNARFINFNHPNTGGTKVVGEYGQDLYATMASFVRAADPIVASISIISTVANGHVDGLHATSEAKTHRDMQWENYYQRYLNYGFHLSPAANQDTHRKNAGSVTAARTAVWARTATYDDLLDAISKNRVYATEDDELAVRAQVLYKGRTYELGDTIPLGKTTADVTLKLKVWQVTGHDNDSTDEGPYTIDVVSDWQGKDGRQASIWETYTTTASGDLTRTIPVNAGEYFYLVITETNGNDNPEGDGADDENNETGEEERDGKRDNMNDSAWTSPFWFKR